MKPYCLSGVSFGSFVCRHVAFFFFAQKTLALFIVLEFFIITFKQKKKKLTKYPSSFEMYKHNTPYFYFDSPSSESSQSPELPQAQVTPSRTSSPVTANGSDANVREQEQPTSDSVEEEVSSEEINYHMDGIQYNPVRVAVPRFTHRLPGHLVNVRCRRYFGTHNDPEYLDKDELNDVMQSNIQFIEWFVVYEEIAPTTGHKHYHSILLLKKDMKPHICIEIDPRATWDKMRGQLKTCFKYVSKDDHKYFEYGHMPMELINFVEREDLATRKRTAPTKSEVLWKEAVERAKRGDHSIRDEQVYARFRMYFDDILAASHTDVVYQGELSFKNLWIYGPPGTGKSRLVWDYVTANRLRVYVKNQNKWWDGYDHQGVVLIDDAGEGMKLLAAHLKNWGDRYPFTAEVKGGTRRINTNDFHLIVTSNYSIREIFNATDAEAIERRFDVLQMN